MNRDVKEKIANLRILVSMRFDAWLMSVCLEQDDDKDPSKFVKMIMDRSDDGIMKAFFAAQQNNA